MISRASSASTREDLQVRHCPALTLICPRLILLVILKYAGRDATAAYDEIHAPGIIEQGLSAEQCVGNVDLIESHLSEQSPGAQKPPLHSIISIHDFEDVARATYTAKAFAFYSSAATDLVSHRANLQCHSSILLRPRILRNVKEVSIKRKILGCDSSAPFFVSPAAMARLAHPDGELALARGCGAQGIIQTVNLDPMRTNTSG